MLKTKPYKGPERALGGVGTKSRAEKKALMCVTGMIDSIIEY